MLYIIHSKVIYRLKLLIYCQHKIYYIDSTCIVLKQSCHDDFFEWQIVKINAKIS